MNTTRTALILGLVGMSAGRDKPTCLDCEDAAEEDVNGGIGMPDLPYGGADLMTDNLNGTCGHECVLELAETEYEATGSARSTKR